MSISCRFQVIKSRQIRDVEVPSNSRRRSPVKFATSKSRQIARRPNPVNISMADPKSASALREVPAAIRALADTLQEPLLAATSALSQAEATLASLDFQVVTGQAVLPTKAEALPAVSSRSPVGDDSRRSPLPVSMDQSATLSGLDRSAPSSLVPPLEVSSEVPCSHAPLITKEDNLSVMSRSSSSSKSSCPPNSPKSPSGQTTGRRLSQALCARGSKFDKIYRIN